MSFALAIAQIAVAQAKAPTKKQKGPRALALVELAPNGTAHLVPVAILVDGEFYDASAYKAAPVPMALESGIVYEAERTGTPLGLFTVTGALQGPNNTWAGAGAWVPTGSKPASVAHRAEAKPRDLEEQDGPPVLRRRDAEKPKPAEPASPPTTSGPASSSPTSSTPASATPTPSAPASPTPSPTPAAPASAATPTNPPAQAEPATAADEEDADRPTLHRGKPLPPKKPSTVSATTSPKSLPATTSIPKSAKSTQSGIQIIPAISDAGGPEPHSYAYIMKPDEEQQFRKKILAMAAAEVAARAKQLVAGTIGAAAPAHSTARLGAPASAKIPQPTFDEVQLQVIDPSSSNEPILILMAKARMPQARSEGASDLQYMITLVARQDIYGDLHKVFSNVTDSQHLDVLPRYDFIDAVDADGDGRAELLFRKVSDSASAFTIYRVIGNQLWPLFDGPLGG